MANEEQNPWAKPGIAGDIARDLQVPDDTFVYPFTRKPLSAGAKGKSESGKGRGKVRSGRRTPSKKKPFGGAW